MKSINFELTTSFMYSMNNKQVDCNHIELREPTGKVASIACSIEAILQKGMFNMRGVLGEDEKKEATEAAQDRMEIKERIKEEEEQDEKDEGGGYLFLKGSGEVDKAVLLFRDLFKIVAWMGGEKQITTPRMDEMSLSDFKRMMGVYAANFMSD